jgi:Concanavalin A-like lectin/glucanases superfamily
MIRHPFRKPLFGAQLDLDHSHSVGLVACFRLAEHWTGGDDGSGFFAGVVLDESKFRNHATLSNTGAPTNEGSPYGPVRGWVRGGGGQIVTVPNRVEYEIDGTVRTTFSMESLVAPHSSNPSSGVGIIFAYGDAGLDSAVTNQGYGLGCNPSLNRIFGRVGTTAANAPNGALTCDDQTWSHVVLTYDGANFRRYVNGKLIGTTAKTGYTSSTGQALGIGNTPTGSSTTRAFRGRIAHARLFVNRVLDQMTIEEMSLSPYAAWLGDIATRHAWYFMAGSPIVVGTQSLQLRGNIRGVNTQSLQMRGNIRGVQVQTVDMRARILRVPPTLQMRANLAEPETVADGIIDAWEISDNFGEFSRQFSLTATEIATFAPGNEVRIKAGYDENRITLINATTDQVTVQTGTDNVKVSVSGRDAGAREIASIRITKTWDSTPPKTMPTAHQVITEASAAAGLGIGVLDFPNYSLYQPFVAIGRTVLEIVSELAEPFNQFARVQYVTEIRDRLLSVRKLDYLNVPSGGYQLTREEHASQGRVQRLYLDDPRLNEVDFFVIRGASWTTPKTDLGSTTKIEYSRTVATEEVQASIVGVVQAPADVSVVTTSAAITKDVITETTVVSLCYGDKVLTQTHEEVIDDVLSSRSIERYWYFEPGENVRSISADTDLISLQSATPSSAALLWVIHSKRWAHVDRGTTETFVNDRHTLTQVGAATVFIEKFREVTQYYYNDSHEVITEVHTTQSFDEDTGRWGIANHDTRTHSQVTGGNVRTTLLKYTFEDSRFKLDTADVQNVGGTRPKPNAPASKMDVVTHQAQAPAGEVDADGEPIDFGEGHYIWSFEHPYIGQSVCDDLYAETQRERDFQLAGYRWEELQFEGILNPNIRTGQPLSIEVADGVFKDYWAVSVQHQFTWNHAATSGTARRLTLEELS